MAMEKFHFKHNDAEYTIPFASAMKMGLKGRYMKALKVMTNDAVTDEDKAFVIYDIHDLVKEFAGPETAPAFEDMDEQEFVQFFQDWVEATQAVSGK